MLNSAPVARSYKIKCVAPWAANIYCTKPETCCFRKVNCPESRRN